MATRFTDPRVEARTFAPLVLDMLVTAGDFKAGWVDAFERWYPAEQDLRGHDETLGWLHAVAHGADLLACFGRHPEVAPVRMLDLAAARLMAPTDHVYDQLEDDRLARAIARVLTRTDLSERDAVGWLDEIADRFGADRISTPVPAHLSNCLRTLRLLYILADRGVRPTSELPAEPSTTATRSSRPSPPSSTGSSDADRRRPVPRGRPACTPSTDGADGADRTHRPRSPPTALPCTARADHSRFSAVSRSSSWSIGFPRQLRA